MNIDGQREYGVTGNTVRILSPSTYWCTECMKEHEPNDEHVSCEICGRFLHKKLPEDAYADYRGWRFRPPFCCMCCGKPICHEQWAFSRICGGCDNGRSPCSERHTENRGRGRYYANAEMVDAEEASRCGFTQERMLKIGEHKPEVWFDKPRTGLQRPKPNVPRMRRRDLE